MTGTPGTDRGTSATRRPLHIQSVVKDVLELVRPSLPATVEVRRDIDPRCGTVLATETEIRRIVMNLCTNAFHAMREYGGVLRVNLTRVQVDMAKPPEVKQAQDKRYVKLVVEDTGHGMDEGELRRLFQVNNLRTELSESEGLGFQIVHKTVSALGGVLSIQSRVEDGTRVEICLPACEDPSYPSNQSEAQDQ